MWWSAFPSLTIISGLIMVPWIGNSVVTYMCIGRPCEKHIREGTSSEIMQKHGYRRDWSMTGNDYESRGLDNIED